MSLTSETVKNAPMDEEEKYCICRGAYGNKFMIACDGCEEWFHGSCININSDQAKDVDQYYCPFCKAKDPSLKTVYKRVKEKDREKHKERSKERYKEKLKRKEKRKEEKRSKHVFESESEEEKEDSVSKKKHENAESKEERNRKNSREESKHKSAKGEMKSKSFEKMETDVGESTAMLQTQLEVTAKARTEDSSKFKIPKEARDAKQKVPKGESQKFMRDEVMTNKQQKDEKPKISKEEKIRALEKQKLKEDKLRMAKEEKLKDAKEEKLKVAKEEKLKVAKEEKLKVAKEEKLKIFKEERNKISKDERQKPNEKTKIIKEEKVELDQEKEKKKEDIKLKVENATLSIKEELMECNGENFTVKEEKIVKKEKVSDESDNEVDFDSFLSALSKTSKQRSSALQVSTSEDEDVDVGVMDVVVDTPTSAPKRGGGVGNKSGVKINQHSTLEGGTPFPSNGRPGRPPHTKKQGRAMKKKKGRPRKQTGTKSSTEVGQADVESSEEEEKQCLGPGCCNAARPRSRYCCDECGVALAVKRIKTFMPDKREEMRRGGVARGYDEELMKDLQKQQEIAHQKIKVLQNERLVIMNLIKNAKSDITDNNSEEDMSDDDTVVDNEEMDCVICGMSCTDKSAARHMERCYNKFESKLALGSTVKCHVTWESPVCDAYDRQQGTYCKKLRVLCPDHNKEKEEHVGICGCPLELSKITEDSAVCRKAKRSCNKHIGWERLRLAEIDMQRVLQDLKLEDSFDEMRKVKYRMANRTNLLQVLLNGTIPHGKDTRAIT